MNDILSCVGRSRPKERRNNLNREFIAERLKKLRNAKGETQAETALACGVTPSAYAMYETGDRMPRDEVKVKIAQHFERSVAFIFFDKAVTQKAEDVDAFLERRKRNEVISD